MKNKDTNDLVILIPKIGKGEELDIEKLEAFLQPLLQEIDKGGAGQTERWHYLNLK